jgi:Ca2+/Na+ antiporter
MSLGLPLLGYILWHGPVVWLQVNTLTDSVLLLFSTVVLFVVGLWIRKFVLGKWLGCVLVTVYVFYVLFVAL